MNLNETMKILDRALDLRLPIMLWGPPGVGKSSAVAAAAHARGLRMEDVRLAQLDATDLRGIPVPDRESRRVEWYSPSFLPREGDGILFLDEIDKASALVKNAALQLVLERRLGDYRLPDGWRLVCAGNREEDNSFSAPLGSALANRLLHVEVDADLDTWLFWAREHGIHEDLRAFLSFRPELLYKQTGEHAFPSPRSWEAASRLLSSVQNGEGPALVAAAVGGGTAAEFAAWSKLYRGVDVDAILAGKIPAFSDKDASLRYAVVLAVASRLEKSGLTDDEMKGLAALLDAVTPELRVLLFKSLPAELVARLSVHPALRKAAARLVIDYVGA